MTSRIDNGIEDRTRLTVDAGSRRSQMRKKLLQAGPDALSDSELLEMILALALPKRNTKPIARLLIARHGSFAGAVNASDTEIDVVDDLKKVVMAFRIVQVAASQLARAEAKCRPILSNRAALKDYLDLAMAHEQIERFRTLYLDSKNRLLADEANRPGSENDTNVFAKEIVQRALELQAVAVVLVRSSIKDRLNASNRDLKLARQVVVATKLLSIEFHDYVVIGNTDWLSLRNIGLL